MKKLDKNSYRFVRWLVVAGFGMHFFIFSAGLAAADKEQDMAHVKSLIDQGKADQAVKWLKKAADKPPQQLEKLSLLTELLIEREEWDDLKSCVKKLELLKPGDPHIPYYLGMAYRESGKFKALIMRNLDWKKSEKYFQQVIEQDSTFKDILFQYGLLEKYRENYFGAVEWGERQRVVHPQDCRAMVGLHQFYDGLLDNKASEVASWLGRRSDLAYSRLYLGEQHRRQGELQDAEAILTDIIQHPDTSLSTIPAILAMARLHYGRQQGTRGEEYFELALKSIKTPLDAALVLEDIKYIMNDSELTHYRQLSSPDLQRIYIRNLLMVRNPIPALGANPRLTEHYRRMLYAEKHFRYDGFRTWFNNPDKLSYLSFPQVYRLNSKFNDKGLVFIRQGEPDDRATSLGADVKPNESWLYNATLSHKKLMFHFVVDENATGNNWRLTALLDQNMLESRLHWDQVFYRMSTASALEIFQYEAEMGDMSKQAVQVGLDTDQHRWSMPIKPLHFSRSVTTFRGGEGKTRYELSYGFAAGQIWPASGQDTSQDYVTVGCSAYDQNWNTIYQVQRKCPAAEIIKATDTVGYWADQFAFEANAEPLHISMFVWHVASKSLGGYRFDYQGRDYQKETADMSDLMLAFAVSPDTLSGPFNKRGLYVYPQPSLTFDKRRLLYTYFELYHMPLGSANRLSCQVQYKLNWLGKSEKDFRKNRGRSGKNKTVTSSTVQRTLTARDQAEYLALDMQQKDSGFYELAVHVTADTPALDFIRTVEFELR